MPRCSGRAAWWRGRSASATRPAPDRPSASGGSSASSSPLSPSSSAFASTYTARWPGNVIVVPDAANTQSVDSNVDTAPRRTLTVVPVASAICDANVRCQTNRYSASSCAVELALDLLGAAERRGRADRLVGLLRVLDLRRVLPRRRRQELLPVLLGDRVAHLGDGLGGQRDVVGSHVGDEPALVQTLRETHHLRRRQPQPAPALLLQGRGHERRLGRRPERPLLDAAHRERRVGEAVGERSGPHLVEGDDLGAGGVAQHAGGVEVLPGGDPRVVDGDERRR